MLFTKMFALDHKMLEEMDVAVYSGSRLLRSRSFGRALASTKLSLNHSR